MLFLIREQIMQKTKAIIADDVDNDVLFVVAHTLALTTAKDDGKQVVYDCSHASTWLRHPNMLPLRGGWQATRFSLG